MLVEGISSQPERDAYMKRCGGSGVKLLGILYAECDKLNNESQIMIVDEFASLTARGLEYATTASLSDYCEQLCSLNNSLNAYSMPPCATTRTSLRLTTSPP